MNKTTTVNISGFVFNIGEQAYERLEKYLESIRNNFHNEAERDEIMADIEARIAELFQEKISEIKEVIVMEDIQEIMDILGHPEDFATVEEEESAGNQQTEGQTEQARVNRKRLFRDRDNANLGGVCSGLGHYFELDPIVFRILFVLLFVLFGTGILLYIILLVVVPEAKTTSDKIEMKGRFVNVESIKEHVANLKQSVTDTAERSNIQQNIKGAVEKGIKTGHSVFKALSKVIGVGFTLGGIVLFILLMLVLFGNTGVIPFIGPDRVSNIQGLIEIIYPGENPSSFIFFSLIVVLTVPLIGLIITGIRVLFSYKQNVKQIAWTLIILWGMAATVLFIFSVDLASDFKNDKEIVYSVPFDGANSNEIMVDVTHDDIFSDHVDPYDDWGASELIKVDDETIYFGLPQLRVYSMIDTGEFKVTIIKESRGSSTRSAIDKIEKIDYPIKTAGNRISLSPYLKIPKADKLRGQYVQVEIFVPNGKTIKFGNNIDRIWRQVDGVHAPWAYSYANTRWYNHNGVLLSGSQKTEPDPESEILDLEASEETE